jgi:hypothetical protein
MIRLVRLRSNHSMNTACYLLLLLSRAFYCVYTAISCCVSMRELLHCTCVDAVIS